MGNYKAFGILRSGNGAHVPERIKYSGDKDFRRYEVADDEWIAATKARRLSLGLNGKQLAELAGIGTTNYYHYEKGYSRPNPVTRGKISKALDDYEIEIANRRLSESKDKQHTDVYG